jgi:spore germination cell wall hydrolase CwlJ-like protein
MKWFFTACLCVVQLKALAVTYEERAVSAVLMGEAWSDGQRGMTAVAEVIHQRAVEKRQAPLQVVSACRGRTHAFSCLNGTTLDRLIGKFSIQPGYEKALQLAQIVCQNPERLPGLANFANHFTRASERPYWARGKRPVAIVGRHAFYRLEHY